jgi:toxin YoeB
MRLVFTEKSREDHGYWQAQSPPTLRRLDYLLECTVSQPFTGPGDPLPLRHLLEGCWSRRIDGEHRLVYLVDGEDVVVLQARYHYGDGCEIPTSTDTVNRPD